MYIYISACDVMAENGHSRLRSKPGGGCSNFWLR